MPPRTSTGLIYWLTEHYSMSESAMISSVVWNHVCMNFYLCLVYLQRPTGHVKLTTFPQCHFGLKFWAGTLNQNLIRYIWLIMAGNSKVSHTYTLFLCPLNRVYVWGIMFLCLVILFSCLIFKNIFKLSGSFKQIGALLHAIHVYFLVVRSSTICSKLALET